MSQEMKAMIDVNVIFCRSLLTEMIPAIRAAGFRIISDGWVWHAGRGHWEFHGPDAFYWHGHAHNAYDARYKGWMAWLEHMERSAEDPRNDAR